MSTPFERALARLLPIEGGYANDPDDNGGETMYGITEAVARAFGYTGPMKDIPMETVRIIYRTIYWKPLCLNMVSACDEELACDLFDTQVNCVPGVAATFLQTALNALNRAGKSWPNIEVDGKMGPATLSALSSVPASDLKFLRKLYDAQRVTHYLKITQRNESQEKFIRSWLNRV